MGKNSKISWTNHTFNPWWGCARVSPGCQHCYAEELDGRWFDGVNWGDTKRRFMKEVYWDQVTLWDKEAKKKETPTTVFCASMSDVFEDLPDLFPLREHLWKLIEKTTSLTWLLLTKRPANIHRLVPQKWLLDGFPNHVWLGVSIELERYWHRLAMLGEFQVHRFVSAEPMLGPISLKKYGFPVNWVICGGESGPGCRPMVYSWATDLMHECKEANVPFFMKQLGGHPDKRDKIEEFPPVLRVQEFPEF